MRGRSDLPVLVCDIPYRPTSKMATLANVVDEIFASVSGDSAITILSFERQFKPEEFLDVFWLLKGTEKWWYSTFAELLRRFISEVFFKVSEIKYEKALEVDDEP